MPNEVPGPQAWPFIGNALDLRRGGEIPPVAIARLADQYGPIFRIYSASGGPRIVVSSQKLVNELCDETRFGKLGGTPGSKPPESEEGDALGVKKTGPASGLFFARSDDPDWSQAHRILMPAFGPLNIATMFDEMHDLAKQLALNWARRGPDHKIDSCGDFTRLTLDSLALCAMGFRFNSFYQESLHPFVGHMTQMLDGIGQRNSQLGIVSRWQNVEGKIADGFKGMTAIARELLQARRDNPTNKNDLLNAMINSKDPKTGEKMRDELIMANMTTFLVAGHETTSGMLTFAMYFLLRNPAAYKSVQEEVDRVVGKDALQPHHLKGLKYLNATLRETLRLFPTAPGFTLVSKSKESHFTIGDYVIEGKPAIAVSLMKLHRDPEVYGDDADQFRPERMLDEHFDKLPPNSWKPFGNGTRACIGRSFAWQEALMALAILFQRFNFRLDDPSYELRVRFTLTIKPQDLFIHATLRDDLDATALEQALNSGISSIKSKKPQGPITNGTPKPGSEAQKLSILFGSNTGTCEALSQRLIVDATGHGFAAEKAPLDSFNDQLPKDRPVVIICPSYEGQPPDNAIHFVEWLQNLSGDELKGTKYAVFGCGHHDWHDSFHRVPKLIDELVSKHGGERITNLGLCDVANADVMDQFDEWKDGSFWPALTETSHSAAKAAAAADSGPGLELEVATNQRAQALNQDVDQAVVLDARTLTSDGEPEKRHLELHLPSDMTYQSGDYLAVLPLNPAVTVRRVTKRFGLPWDATIRLAREHNTTSLPSDEWIAVHSVLRGFVELSQPPSRKDLRRFMALTSDAAAHADLDALLKDKSKTKESVSVLDVLERHPSIQLSFAEFLTLLPPLRVRLYSISSSPLNDPGTCSISYGVLDGAAPSATGWTSARHPGVASSYLKLLGADDQLHVAIRPSRSGFHLPAASPSNPVPIIMICAGTGLAPFRAFVQERALQLRARGGDRAAAGLGPALLFVGCRTHNTDKLYDDELSTWEKEGAVSLRYAFSRSQDQSQGCKYVQDRVRKDAAEVKALWDAGAKIYICGASKLVREVSDVLKEELFKGLASKQAMEEYAKATKGEKIVTDVFG